ncbi:MAG: hypothetical protein A2Z59_13805 [Nitrospinae bacterium RIFCSPLOWO2_02_39_17]|nr:MAG: hypothetical protein A2Z59_13805 [Nitrospinae bacterium RIFCSPLOWO2_02_39_17]
MSEFSELLKATASLLWPILGFVALFLFRNEIANAIRRIRKGKILGQEVELGDELVRLQKTATEASEEVASLPSVTTEPETEKLTTNENDPVKGIIKEAGRSPKTALILVASEVEKEARQTLASIGKLQGARKMTLSQTIDKLDSHYGLPRHVSSSLRLFWDTRNKIIHGGETEDRNILSAIDSGVTILKTLQSLPRETNWVHNGGVTIYSDPACQHEIQGAKGIILRTESSSGARTFFRIFPSTRTHFKKGKRVSWEWSFEKTWAEAWYKDPDTSEIKQAWSSSAEFIGRNLDDV